MQFIANLKQYILTTSYNWNHLSRFFSVDRTELCSFSNTAHWFSKRVVEELLHCSTHFGPGDLHGFLRQYLSILRIYHLLALSLREANKVVIWQRYEAWLYGPCSNEIILESIPQRTSEDPINSNKRGYETCYKYWFFLLMWILMYRELLAVSLSAGIKSRRHRS